MSAGYGDAWYDDPTLSQEFADIADAPGFATDAGETSQELSTSLDYPYVDTTTGDEPSQATQPLDHPDATSHPSPVRGSRIIGREQDGSDPRYRTRAAGGQGLEYDVPETTDIITEALSQLNDGPAAIPVTQVISDMWNPSQVPVPAGGPAVKIASEDAKRTKLTILNTDPSAAPVWLSSGSQAGGGLGAIYLPVGASITLTHGAEVWATAPAGAPVPVIASVAVPASASTEVVPVGAIGPVTVTNVGPGGMQFNYGAVTLTSGAAVGQSFTFPAGTTLTSHITAFDGSASTALVQYNTAGTAPVMLNVSVEKLRSA